MILNLAISTAIGIVPFIGDILLASYRANVRNARLLENFLLLRAERIAKGGSRTAPATSENETRESNDPGVDDDEGDTEEARGTGRIEEARGTGRIEEDNAGALSEKERPDAASLSQPGAGGASSSECERTALVLDDADKDNSADVGPVPDGPSEGEGARNQLRPPRNALEIVQVQHRDSRFIEDVT